MSAAPLSTAANAARGGGQTGTFHDGRLRDLKALFDPNRLRDSYAGACMATVLASGHPYGLELPDTDRVSLLEFQDSMSSAARTGTAQLIGS